MIQRSWSLKTSQNWSTHMHRVFPWNIEVQLKSSLRWWIMLYKILFYTRFWSVTKALDGFCYEVCLNAERLLRPSPIHLAWKLTSLEKQQIVLSTYDRPFNKTIFKKIFFSRNPLVPSELECIVSFLFLKRLKCVSQTWRTLHLFVCKCVSQT